MAVLGDNLEMVQYLLLKGMSPMVTNKLLMTPLYYAIENNCEKIFELLIHDKRQVLDHSDKFGDTILHVAAREGQTEFVR